MDKEVETKINELNAKWRNYVAKILGMDPSGPFQIAQGAVGLGPSDSSGLFNMSDAVPPDSAAGYYDPSSMVRRSRNYIGLLSSLLPEGGSDLRDVLGSMYAKWIAYKNDYYAKIEFGKKVATQQELFEFWANANLDPKKAQAAIATFKQAAATPLNRALDAYSDAKNQQTFVDPAGDEYALFKYSPLFEDAVKAVKMGPSAQLTFKASQAESDLKHTFAQGSASGFYSIFSGGASASFESLDKKAASSDITIEGTINKYATVPVAPGNWYDSNEVQRAFNAKNDNNVWDPLAAGDWNDFFGQPNGELARYVSQFLLVSDYKITVTIHASFSEQEFEEIRAKANFGIWPFFSASADAIHTDSYTLNKDGSLSYTNTLDKGLIEVWGVTVQKAQ